LSAAFCPALLLLGGASSFGAGSVDVWGLVFTSLAVVAAVVTPPLLSLAFRGVLSSKQQAEEQFHIG
jgi:hypothetical protein